ncbi:MAG: transglutaminase domain-containing protein [Kiritimatiellae bacterium]|nr:transglutaminase domain-containing protein [Kiritimatiellia bacterium]
MRTKRNRRVAGLTAAAAAAAFLSAGALLTGCNRERLRAAGSRASESRYGVVTADIQAGIEHHIQEQVRRGGGYFTIPFGAKTLQLRLVRVHVEYLATLSPTNHFACVDLAGRDGEFYDVDFFLAGRPGSMTVTETMVHKVNGQPLYLWEQQPDKTWGRVPVDGASHQLLGLVRGRDEFEFVYRATLPEIDGPAAAWLPMPQSDAFQTVTVQGIDAPAPHRILSEHAHGNKVLYMALGPEHSGAAIELRFHVVRLEKGAYEAALDEPERYLKPESLVPADPRFTEAVRRVVEGKQGALVRARAIYDTVIDQMRYMKYGDGWGKGDAVYACHTLYGNCTDFHAYFIALARAAGIPARFAIGAALPSERDEGGVDGYHCWAEFYAEGKWWPVDISEADKYTALSIYYFGHHPANRIEFSRGRDLIVEPGPAAGPINFLAYPVLEIDGQPARAATAFFFRRAARARS